MPITRPRETVIFIVGPTAIGKTRISIKVARRIKGEIISADSMQVYKGMAVLSQAPTAVEKKSATHYLAGNLDPRREYSAAVFSEKASRIIASIIKRKKVPVVVGGSGLYVKALVDGLFPSPDADLRFRKKSEQYVSRYGSENLHAKLSKIDPEAAARIHPNDARRVIRALEIYHATGRTMTELKSQTRGLKDRFRIKIFGLTSRRDRIYANINERVDEMFASGAVREVKKLKRKALSKTAKAVLGYKEIAGHLNGEYDLEWAKYFVKRNTRRFAKRQLAWFRKDARIRWFDTARFSDADIVKRIAKEV